MYCNSYFDNLVVNNVRAKHRYLRGSDWIQPRLFVVSECQEWKRETGREREERRGDLSIHLIFIEDRRDVISSAQSKVRENKCCGEERGDRREKRGEYLNYSPTGPKQEGRIYNIRSHKCLEKDELIR